MALIREYRSTEHVSPFACYNVHATCMIRDVHVRNSSHAWVILCVTCMTVQEIPSCPGADCSGSRGVSHCSVSVSLCTHHPAGQVRTKCTRVSVKVARVDMYMYMYTCIYLRSGSLCSVVATLVCVCSCLGGVCVHVHFCIRTCVIILSG